MEILGEIVSTASSSEEEAVDTRKTGLSIFFFFYLSYFHFGIHSVFLISNSWSSSMRDLSETFYVVLDIKDLG